MQSAMLSVALCLGSLSVASAQGVGGYKQEAGPEITLRKCTAPGSCKANKHKLTMDANWRWVHVDGDYTNCYKGNVWTEECPGDGAECAKACVLEGIDAEQYEGTYGVTTTGDGVTMNLVNEHDYGISVGARLYVLNGEDKYEMFKMLNQEFAFDAEMGPLECGINGAVYFIEMQENGGKDIGNNKAGAKYGTGYCDAQCPHDIKFIDGEANLKDWQPNKKTKVETWASAITVLAATRWTFGKRMQGQVPTLRILAVCPVCTGARVQSAAIMTKMNATRAYATRTAVISLHGAWVLENSMARAVNSQSTQKRNSRKSHSSSPTTVQKAEIWWKSAGSGGKMVRSS